MALNFVLLILNAVAVVAEKCRILAFEGGGSRGAYQAGVVSALADSLPPEDVAWNIVSGVSTGSLNTLGCVQFPIGQERSMGQFLVDTWKSLNGSASAYVEWPYGLIEGLLFGPSLYDSSPLRELLVTHWKGTVHRNFTIPATDFNSGSLKIFDETLSPDLLPEAVMCSAAPPFYFPPQHFQDTIYVDGGCLINLDVASPVNKCKALGFKDSDISVDMIFLTSTFLNEDKGPWSPLGVRKRVKKIAAFDYLMWFGYHAHRAFPNVEFRYSFVPSQTMPGGEIPLDFEKETILSEIELGRQDALRIIARGKNGLKALSSPPRIKVRAFSRPAE